jgi:hypothetical protein
MTLKSSESKSGTRKQLKLYSRLFPYQQVKWAPHAIGCFLCERALNLCFTKCSGQSPANSAAMQAAIAMNNVRSGRRADAQRAYVLSPRLSSTLLEFPTVLRLLHNSSRRAYRLAVQF